MIQSFLLILQSGVLSDPNCQFGEHDTLINRFTLSARSRYNASLYQPELEIQAHYVMQIYTLVVWDGMKSILPKSSASKCPKHRDGPPWKSLMNWLQELPAWHVNEICVQKKSRYRLTAKKATGEVLQKLLVVQSSYILWKSSRQTYTMIVLVTHTLTGSVLCH